MDKNSPSEGQPVSSAGRESITYLSKKDYGTKFKLKGAELRRAHDAYRVQCGMVGSSRLASLPKSKVMASEREATTYLSKKDYGQKHKLKGAELKRAHHTYRVQFGVVSDAGLTSLPKQNSTNFPRRRTSTTIGRKAHKKPKKSKQKRGKRKLRIIYTAFESNRRRH